MWILLNKGWNDDDDGDVGDNHNHDHDHVDDHDKKDFRWNWVYCQLCKFDFLDIFMMEAYIKGYFVWDSMVLH